MSTIQKFHRQQLKLTDTPPVVDPVVCKDGFRVSVQASSAHYCSPRENRKDGKYTSWELGFPSELDPLIAEYAEDNDTTETVFGRVPTEVVDALIAKHGGLKA